MAAGKEAAGLAGASPRAEAQLRAIGTDPHRLAIFRLGRPTHDLAHALPHWARRMLLGYVLWVALNVLHHLNVAMPHWLEAALSLILAAFAGMSEYVILYRAHRNRQYRIALANAFGGITQLMYLLLIVLLVAHGGADGTGQMASSPLTMESTWRG